MTDDERPNYRARRQARAERLRGWAGKREDKAQATLDAGAPYREDHAFNTQPGHIPERARVIAREDRAYESMDKAASMRSRADGIEHQAANAIYSDDPDAVEQLRARVAALEAKRERIKAYNKTCRKGQPDTSLLEDDEKVELVSAIRVWGDTQCAGGKFPSYVLSNLTGELGRNRKRLDGMTRDQAPIDQPPTSGMDL